MKHKCWQEAIEAELLALEENQTWGIVPCPPSIKPLGNKFVINIRIPSD